MIQISIFDFKSYKDFLRQNLDAKGRSERGIRSRLAEAVRCHTAYVSQVLNGDAHFSLEQAEAAGNFLMLNKNEIHYLLLLVQFERAGTPTLRSHFETQMKELAKKQMILKERLDFQKSLSREDQATFYSAWYFGAIHVLVSVPGCHTVKGISDYLKLPPPKVLEVLEFLLRVGLVKKENDEYSVGTGHIHLEHDSPMINKHHTNWRIKAIQSLDHASPNDLHYSSVITCSQEDSKKIKAALVKAIEEVRSIVRPSKDEGGFAYSIDFFDLKNS